MTINQTELVNKHQCSSSSLLYEALLVLTLSGDDFIKPYEFVHGQFLLCEK